MRWSLVILRLCVFAPLCCDGGITGTDGTESASSRQGGTGQDATPFSSSTFDNISRRISVARTTVCAVTDDGLACWGTETPEHLRSDRSIFAVSCGLFHTCVLHEDERTKEHGAVAHRVECFGGDKFQQVSGAAIADGGLLSICSGTYFSCGIAPPDWVNSPPSHEGEKDGRASRNPGGRVLCWGEADVVGQAGEATSGALFESVACGAFGACAVEQGTQRVRCWGDEPLLDVPPLHMSRVSVGVTHACGILAGGGRLVCWGSGLSSLEMEWLGPVLRPTEKHLPPIGAMAAVTSAPHPQPQSQTPHPEPRHAGERWRRAHMRDRQ